MSRCIVIAGGIWLILLQAVPKSACVQEWPWWGEGIAVFAGICMVVGLAFMLRVAEFGVRELTAGWRMEGRE